MKEKQISEIMEKYVQTGEMAGGILMVHKAGGLLYKEKWGYANVDKKTPVQYDSIFRMASISKVFTAIGILKLMEQGKIGLDEEVPKYLPEFSRLRFVNDKRFEGMEGLETMQKYLMTGEKATLDDVKTVLANRELTIRDLLTHSSGLEMGAYGFLSRLHMDYKEDTLATRMEKFCRLPLDFQPGTGTGYSPTANFDMLARIIEIVSGLSFDVFMEEEVFHPLGMKDAAYHLSEEQRKRLVPLYKPEDGRQRDVSGTEEDIDRFGSIGPQYMSGSAGLYCTAEDFDKAVQMLCNGGILSGIQILRPETVESMHKERAYKHLEPEPGMVWGLGVKIRQDPEKAESFARKDTYGWSGAFGTHFFISPNEKLAATFTMNRADIGGSGSYISKKAEELVFGIWR